MSTEPEGEGRRGSRATGTVLALVAGVVVLIVGLSALAGGDDDEPGEAADEKAADDDSDDGERGERSTSTSLSRPSTTTTLPGLLPDGGVPEAAGAVAIHASGDQLVVADLGTGRQIVVPGPANDVQQVVVHGSNLLALTMGGEAYLLDLKDVPAWAPLDEEVGTGIGTLSNGSLISVGETMVGAIDDGGALAIWELPVSLSWWSALGRIGDDVVLNTGDGVFLFDRARTGRRISSGTAFATNGQLVLVRTCDDSYRCRLDTIDTEGVIESTLPPLPEGLGIDSATLSPDGRSVLVGGRREYGSSGEFEAYRSDGGPWVSAGTSGAWSLSQATWIPSSGSVVWRTRDVMAIHVVPAVGEPLDLRLHSRTGFGFGSVAVTTLDSLPEEWRAELAG